MDYDSTPRWSPNGDEILVTDPEGSLVRWAYPDGPRQVIGTGTYADWQRNALDVPCLSDSDCDDGNSCTADACVASACIHDLLTGDLCGDGGWCENGRCFEPECGSGLPACDDGNVCTVDTCNDNECLFDALAALGSGCDDGDDCTENDICDGEGGCSGSLILGCGSCLPKHASCTSDDDCCSNKCRGTKCR